MSNLNIGDRRAYKLVLSKNVEADAVDGVLGMVGKTLATGEAVRLAVSEGLSRKYRYSPEPVNQPALSIEMKVE